MKQIFSHPTAIYPQIPHTSPRNKKKKPKKTIVYVLAKKAGVMTISTTLPKGF